MNYSEQILMRIHELVSNGGMDIMEACVTICDENDIDPDEFCLNLDKSALEQLKISLIKSGAVRKCVANMDNVNTLFGD